MASKKISINYKPYMPIWYVLNKNPLCSITKLEDFALLRVKKEEAEFGIEYHLYS